VVRRVARGRRGEQRRTGPDQLTDLGLGGVAAVEQAAQVVGGPPGPLRGRGGDGPAQREHPVDVPARRSGGREGDGQHRPGRLAGQGDPPGVAAEALRVRRDPVQRQHQVGQGGRRAPLGQEAEHAEPVLDDHDDRRAPLGQHGAVVVGGAAPEERPAVHEDQDGPAGGTGRDVHVQHEAAVLVTGRPGLRGHRTRPGARARQRPRRDRPGRGEPPGPAVGDPPPRPHPRTGDPDDGSGARAGERRGDGHAVGTPCPVGAGRLAPRSAIGVR
jgi:hypothetical protein